MILRCARLGVESALKIWNGSFLCLFVLPNEGERFLNSLEPISFFPLGLFSAFGLLDNEIEFVFERLTSLVAKERSALLLFKWSWDCDLFLEKSLRRNPGDFGAGFELAGSVATPTPPWSPPTAPPPP